MPSRLSKVIILASPLFLAACGEGWEMSRVSGIVPYVPERTAGTGVAYVRAKMLPEKAIVAAPAKEEIKSAEPVFEKKQQK